MCLCAIRRSSPRCRAVSGHVTMTSSCRWPMLVIVVVICRTTTSGRCTHTHASLLRDFRRSQSNQSKQLKINLLTYNSSLKAVQDNFTVIHYYKLVKRLRNIKITNPNPESNPHPNLKPQFSPTFTQRIRRSQVEVMRSK